MLNIGLQWGAGPLHVAHKVLPDQLEIDPKTGRVKPIQAARHEVGLWSMNLNLVSRLGLLDWLDVRLRFPLRYVNATASFQDGAGKTLENYKSIHHRNETLVGVSDPEIRLGFRPFQLTSTRRWLFEFGAGIDFPLGRIEEDPYEAGKKGLEHQHILFGSGTFDPRFFVTVGYMHRKFQVYLSGFAKGALVENRYGYKEGWLFRGALSIESSLGLKTWSFQFQAAFNHLQASRWSGKVDPDSANGRNDLLLTAGVYWRPNGHWQVSLRASLPIILSVLEGEISQPFVLGLGFQYRFQLF